MDAPTDPAKLRLALEHLEAVQAQRLAERIAAGEVIAIQLTVVAGSQASLRVRVEQAKADKLAELRDAGDRREVVFRIDTVVTGVCGPGEAADPASVPSAPGFSSREDAPRPPRPPPTPAPEVVEDCFDPAEAPQPPVIETYVQVQVRRCHDDDDPGEIAEGWFSIDGKTVTVTDAKGKYVGSRTLLKDENAKTVAKTLLREKSPEAEGFNRVLHYPNAGLA
jgi:hypothetical protein